MDENMGRAERNRQKNKKKANKKGKGETGSLKKEDRSWGKKKRILSFGDRVGVVAARGGKGQKPVKGEVPSQRPDRNG